MMNMDSERDECADGCAGGVVEGVGTALVEIVAVEEDSIVMKSEIEHEAEGMVQVESCGMDMDLGGVVECVEEDAGAALVVWEPGVRELRPAAGQCVDDFMEAFELTPAGEAMAQEEWDALYEKLLVEERAALEAEREAVAAQERANRIAQLRPVPEPRQGVECTKMGTPCSPKWDEDWIEAVDRTEEEVGHRCCGARVNGVYPCELEASHENGRCRFHGGGLGTGAQKGNTNARIHGLYSRRLQQCGGHCPHWRTCPFAGDDIKNLPEAKRPVCTFEEQEMDMLRKMDSSAHLTFVPVEERSLEELREDPYPVRGQLMSLRENLNMLQVMITRAANALSIKALTVETVDQTATRYHKNEKPSALMQAHRMLTREHRLTLGVYLRVVKEWGLPKYESD